MNSDKVNFWAGCPFCRKTFGVPPRFILQYLERLVKQAEGNMAEAEEEETPNPPAQAKEKPRFIPDREPRRKPPYPGKYQPGKYPRRKEA